VEAPGESPLGEVDGKPIDNHDGQRSATVPAAARRPSRVLSRDIVQYWVNVSLGAKVVAGNIFCAVAGRIYPEQW